MGMSQFDPVASDRRAWSAGRKVGAKRALKARQIWAICFFLISIAECVFDLAVDGKLRSRNVVRTKSKTLSLAGKYAPVLMSCCRRRIGWSSSSCWQMHEQAYLPGWNGRVAHWQTMSFRAASTPLIILAPSTAPTPCCRAPRSMVPRSRAGRWPPAQAFCSSRPITLGIGQRAATALEIAQQRRALVTADGDVAVVGG